MPTVTQTNTAGSCSPAQYCSGISAGHTGEVSRIATATYTSGTRTEVVISLDGNTTKRAFMWDIPLAAADAPVAGVLLVNTDFTTVAAKVDLISIHVCRISSGCSNQESLGSWTTGVADLTTGIHYCPITISAPSAWNTGDRLAIIYVVYNTNHGAVNIGITPDEHIYIPDANKNIPSIWPESSSWVGPFIDTNDNLYVFMECPGFYIQTGGGLYPYLPALFKSTDGGNTWVRYPLTTSERIDLESAVARQDPTNKLIYIIWQATDPYFDIYRTSDHASPDSWATGTYMERVEDESSVTEQTVTMEFRSDGTVVAAYQGDAVSGDDPIRYCIRSSGGTWGTPADLFYTSGKSYRQVVSVKNPNNDDIYFFGFNETDKNIECKVLTSGDSLSTIDSQVNSTANSVWYSALNGKPMLFPVYWLDGSDNKVMIVWRDNTDSKLEYAITTNKANFSTQATCTDLACYVNTSGQSVYCPAASLAIDTATDDIYLLYADNSTQDIYANRYSGGSWGTEVEEKDGVDCAFISANYLNNGTDNVISYVYQKQGASNSNIGPFQSAYDEMSLWSSELAVTTSFLSSGEVFYPPTITVGAVSVATAFLDSGEVFYPPTIDATYEVTTAFLTSGEVFYAPTITVGAVEVTSAFLASGEAFYPPTITTGPVDVTTAFLSSGEAFYPPTINVGAVTVTSAFLASGEAFYAPTIDVGPVAVTSAFLASGEAFYPPTVAVEAIEVTGAFLASGEIFYAPTITVGAVEITTAFLASGEAFYPPTIDTTYEITTAFLSSGEAFYPPTIDAIYDITTAFLSSGEVFYAPTITVGAVEVTTAFLTSGEIFYPPTVVLGAGDQAVTTAFLTSGEVFYAPTVAPGPVTVTTAFLTSGEQFFPPAVDTTYDITTAFLTSGEIFYAPTVWLQEQYVTTAFLTSGEAFYPPTVVLSGAPQPVGTAFLTSGEAFYAPTVWLQEQYVTSAFLASGEVFYPPTLDVGAVEVGTAFLASGEAFYPPTVETDAIAITTAFLSSGEIFYAPMVSPGAVEVTTAFLASSEAFYAPSISVAAIEVTSAFLASSEVFYAPSVDVGAVSVTTAFLASGEQFYPPIIGAGAIEVTSAFLASGEVFYPPSVARTIATAFLGSSGLFYPPVVSVGAVTIVTAFLASAGQIFPPSIKGIGFLIATADVFPPATFTAEDPRPIFNVDAEDPRPIFNVDGDVNEDVN